MYQIRYMDPFTSKLVEVVAETLDEAVSAITKARDELYFQGSSSTEPKLDPGYGTTKPEQNTKEDEPSSPSLETEIKTEKPLKDFWDEEDVQYSGLYFMDDDDGIYG